MVANTQDLKEEIQRCKNKIRTAEDALAAKQNISDHSNLNMKDLTSQQINSQDSAAQQSQVLKEITDQTQRKIRAQRAQLAMLEQELEEKELRSFMQQSEIENKSKLIDTRDRMFQLSQEKNVYKKKIIYTLLSLIIMTVILMMVSYTYFNRH